MATHQFRQVDVFGSGPLTGNPVAVVHDADDLDDAQMQLFAQWTNLSETTFLLPPTDPAADYRVRIFTPGGELPFAGHPTIGSCHAWLQAGGKPKAAGQVVQQCGAGLGLAPASVRDAAWLTNGPRQLALLVDSAATVLSLKPDHAAIKACGAVGVIGPQPAGTGCDFEVRFFAATIGIDEDPVTGSLNANLARWLIDSDRAPAAYVAAQGTAMGRAGRVHVLRDADGTWIGGDVAGCITGVVTL